MGLPKIDMPLFELEVPSTKQKVKYRPFTVKEEKILLIAQESKDMDQMIVAIKQIINNCVVKIDVDELAMFDLEYILINVRAKSVDNELTFYINDPDTKEKTELVIDINDIKMVIPETHSNTISLSSDTSIVMRYPTINELNTLISNRNEQQILFEIMLNCIDKLIVEEDQVYNFKDYSREEIEAFIDDLTSTTINKIKTFFETMPRLRHECPYKDSNGKQKTFVVEGMETFFI